MEKTITIEICRPMRILPGYPMAGRVFEDFIVKGYKDNHKSFGGVAHSAPVAASWLVDFLNA